MKQRQREQVQRGCAVGTVVLLAWLCRVLPLEGVPSGLQEACGILRSLLYLSLFAGWGISLYNRTVHPQVRRLLLNVDLLMLFWILVRTLRFQLNTPPGIDRMLGYLYYAPMLGIPVLCVQLVLTVDRSERYRLSAWARMLWLPSAVLLELVLTNDLHQQVFRLQQPWNEKYQYGWLFGLVVGWIVICILLAFGIIAHKSRNPRILRRLPLPAIPLVLLGIYAVLYGFHFPLIRQFLGDMTIVHCLMTAASLEGGLRCGLIQSNTGYEELLRVTSLAVQLVDRQGNVYCCSENGRMVDRRELQAAMHGTVQLDEHTLLRSAPVQGGYVMWQTDITELVENMERLKENRTELAERNYLEQQNYEAERKTNALREKNRLYDLLQRRLAPQIIRMDQLLTRYRTAPEADRRQLLGQVAVLGAYLKRGANLMFLAQKHRYVPSAELRYALEESISSLELAGVECAVEVTQGVRLPAEAAAACYSRFESVVEGALGQLDALFVRAIWKDHRLNLYLSVETGADLKAVCPAAVQEAPGSHPADPLDHASHSLTIPPKSCSPRISCQSLSPEAAGPHAAASPRRVPQALRGFFCWRHGPFRQKKNRAAPHLCGAVLSGCAGSAHGLPGFPEGCGSARGFLFLRSLRVVFQVQLGHQLVADDGQHLFQLLHVLFGEALVHPLDHCAQVGVADVVVVDILLGGPQVILPAVGGGLDLFHIALAHQRADLIRRVGGGDLHHPGKLRNGGLPHGHNALHAKGFHRGQGRLTGGKALEHVLVEMELELGIDIVECFFQHGTVSLRTLNFL